MLEQGLLRNECYICQELCVKKSPCECEAYVHTNCLEKFTDISENKYCTICKTRIVEDSDSDSEPDSEPRIDGPMPPQLFLLSIFIIYLITGILGKIVLGISEQTKDIFSFWTGTFFMCSCIISACVLLPIYLVIICTKYIKCNRA